MSSTFVGILRRRAETAAERLAYRFLRFGADAQIKEELISYGELWLRAGRIAAHLAATVDEGKPVLLVYPPGLEFFEAFFGSLLAGVVAVPCPLPEGIAGRGVAVRLQAIALDASAAAVLHPSRVERASFNIEQIGPALAGLRWIATDRLPEPDASMSDRVIESTRPAMLQYTSGSTSAPRGVIVTHENLVAVQAAIRGAFGHTDASSILTWLPMYHDMGLIGCGLQPVFLGSPCTLMAPSAFLAKPLRWLKAIEHYRATTSGGPNFAFEHCIRNVPERAVEDLDLSSWSVAFNGSEPVRAETMREFTRKFSRSGFRGASFLPCYGLAEASLLVAGGPAGSGFVELEVDAEALESDVVAQPTAGMRSRTLVSSGAVDAQLDVRVVESQTLRSHAADRVGEILVSGPTVADGYWQRAEETAQTFQARCGDERRYLRTGDLGFVHNGQLFVTGRAKDLIVVRGRNLCPHDIEGTVLAADRRLRANGCIAFGSEGEGGEDIVVLVEAPVAVKRDRDRIVARIQELLIAEHDVRAATILFEQPGSLPRTSSGKLKRRAARLAWLARAGGTNIGLSINRLEGARARSISAASSSTEIVSYLREVVAAVTNLPSDRIDDRATLAAHGLDSLGSFDLLFRIERDCGATGLELPLLRRTTITQLAEQLAQLIQRSSAAEATVATAPCSDLAPMSCSQQALWFMHQVSPHACNVAIAMRLHGDIEPMGLSWAIQRWTERHAALRTRLLFDREPSQQVIAAVEGVLAVRDAARDSDDSILADMRMVADEPFSLSRPPLFRVRLYRRSGGDSALLVVFHHAVVDLWSCEILIGELLESYGRWRAGALDRAVASPPDYRSYTSLEQTLSSGQSGLAALDYWRQRLEGYSPVATPPGFAPIRAPMPGCRDASISAALTSRITELAHAAGVSPASVTLAAFGALVSRLVNAADVCIGVPFACRRNAAFRDTVGCFVNPVVIRLEPNARKRFSELIQETDDAVGEAFAHQELPFARIVEQRIGRRNADGSTLLTFMFAYQQARTTGEFAQALLADSAGVTVEAADIRLETMSLGRRASFAPLMLKVTPVGEILRVRFEFDGVLFSSDAVAEIERAYLNVLRELCADPRRRVGEALLVPVGELPGARGVRVAGEEQTSGELLHELFEARVREAPDAIAIIDGQTRVSYAELDQRANALADSLRELGGGAGRIVAIYLERSAEMVVAVLASLKSGAAYLALDPGDPEHRSAFALRDSRACVVVTERSLRNRLHPSLARIVVDEARGKAVRESFAARVAGDGSLPRSRFANDARTQAAAYMIYTSGSTGEPKAVVVSHHSVLQLFRAAGSHFSLDRKQVWTLFHSLAFDFSVWELWGALLFGGRVVIIPYWMCRASSEFLEVVVRERVTMLSQTPSAFYELQHDLAKLSPGELSVESIVLGGEQLDPARLGVWFEACTGGTKLINMYGITEATVHATFREITAADREICRSPIGKPLAHMEIFVLDAGMQPVPRGVIGEMYLAGQGLALGYHRRPSLTARRFVPHPFCSDGGRRMYRTGDLAWWSSEGELMFSGRSDQQIKIRGYRVELGEISAALLKHPGIADAYVLLHQRGPGYAHLIAYVVCRESMVSTRELRAHLSRLLPAYMVPAIFVTLESLPRNRNSKVDSKKLPPPEFEASVEVSAEATEMEQLVRGVWCQFLGGNPDLDCPFFDAGGHSLIMVQVGRELSTRFELEIPLMELYRHSTIRSCALYLTRTIREKAQVATPPASATEPSEPV